MRSRTDCTACGPGTYSTLSGAPAAGNCTQCFVGSYASEWAATACMLCGLGTFAALPAASACAVCAIGRFATASGASTCFPCPSGTYATAQAVATQSGTAAAANVSARVTLRACGDATTSCAACGGEGAVVLCAATWLPAAAGCPVASLPCASSRPLVNLTTTVSRVAPNKTTSGIVGTSSVATPPGSARNSSFSGECSASIGANYEVGNVSLDLWWDVIGSWSQNKSNNSQWSNFSGEGNSTAGRCLIGCVPCAPGTYLSASGATEPAACVLCAAGTFAARPGLTSCAVCVAGSYTPSRGQSACTACVSGTYGNKTNATNRRVCALCAAGTTASAPGSSSCTLCTAGTFQTPGPPPAPAAGEFRHWKPRAATPPTRPDGPQEGRAG